MPVTARPKLPSLTTPTSANFPKDALLSASSVRTPLSESMKGPLQSAGLYSAGLPSAGLPSAPLNYPPTPSMLSARQDLSARPEDKPEKTPITPPLAYMDFLKSINPASPSVVSPPLTAPLVPTKLPLKRTSTGSSTDTVKTEDSENSNTELDLIDSAPTTASSTGDATDCSCTCGSDPQQQQLLPAKSHNKKPADITLSVKQQAITAAASPLSAYPAYPLSAPPTGPTTFPSLRVPPSPAVDSPVRSPFSARSVKSPFDWDAALKAKRYAEVKPPAAAAPTSAGPPSSSSTIHSSRCDKKGTNVRHIREVVTRTVTYTPRMDPAPRGKRRKLNDGVAEE